MALKHDINENSTSAPPAPFVDPEGPGTSRLTKAGDPDQHGQSRGWWLERYKVGDQAGLRPHAQDALLRDRDLVSRNYDPDKREAALQAGCSSKEALDRAALMHNVETQRRAELFFPHDADAREARQVAFSNLVAHDQEHGNRIGVNADISREQAPTQQLENEMARANRTTPTAEMAKDYHQALDRFRTHPETMGHRTGLAEDHRARTAEVGPRRQNIPADSEVVTHAPQPVAPKPAPAAIKPSLAEAIKIKT